MILTPCPYDPTTGEYCGPMILTPCRRTAARRALILTPCPYDPTTGEYCGPMILTPCPYGPTTGEYCGPMILTPCPFGPTTGEYCGPMILTPCPYDPITGEYCGLAQCSRTEPRPLRCAGDGGGGRRCKPTPDSGAGPSLLKLILKNAQIN